MEVLSFYGKGVASNTFLLINGSDAVIIDASCFDPIVKICNERNLNVRAILLTHGHFDHTLYLSKLKHEFDAPIFIHSADANMLSDGFSSAFNVFFDSFTYDKRPCADIPIVVLTANAIEGSEEKYLRDGFDGYLSKPIVSEKLLEVLKEMLPKEKIVPVTAEEDAGQRQ